MNSNVFFQPFVGKGYAKGGIFGKRIMVLGESHYCEGCLDCGILLFCASIVFYNYQVLDKYQPEVLIVWGASALAQSA